MKNPSLQIAKAFATGSTLRISSANTETNGITVRLYNTVIARRTESGSVEFNLGGFNTPLTRTRINAIARELGLANQVRSNRGAPEQSLTGQLLPIDGWFSL